MAMPTAIAQSIVDTINIDFVKARNQADAIERLANEMEAMVSNDYEPAMNQVKAGWTGPSSVAYLNKGAKLEGDLKDTVQRMRQVAGEIKNAVSILEKAQKEAQQIVSKVNT